MFGLSAATRIYLGVEAVDMRKGFEGLYGLVRDQLGQDPVSGHLFLFSNRTRTRLKALLWDGSGLWPLVRRQFAHTVFHGIQLAADVGGIVRREGTDLGLQRNDLGGIRGLLSLLPFQSIQPRRERRTSGTGGALG